MKRKHWIEISDEPWCPRSIRHAVTDYCRFVTELSGIYNAVAPLLIDALEQTGDRLVLDLGSDAFRAMPSCITQSRWTPRMYPAGCRVFAQCSQRSTISIQTKPALP
jgi:hypothetical protein